MHGVIVNTLPGMSEVPTLFVWTGGTALVRRLIDAFYARVDRDDLFSPLSPGGAAGA